MQDGAPVLIVSDKLARALADQKQPGSRLGDRVRLQGVDREVVGILKEQPGPLARRAGARSRRPTSA